MSETSERHSQNNNIIGISVNGFTRCPVRKSNMPEGHQVNCPTNLDSFTQTISDTCKSYSLRHTLEES